MSLLKKGSLLVVALVVVVGGNFIASVLGIGGGTQVVVSVPSALEATRPAINPAQEYALANSRLVYQDWVGGVTRIDEPSNSLCFGDVMAMSDHPVKACQWALTRELNARNDAVKALDELKWPTMFSDHDLLHSPCRHDLTQLSVADLVECYGAMRAQDLRLNPVN